MKQKSYEVLSDSDIRRVHEASLAVVEETGMLVFSEQALDVLGRGGARVDRSERKARLPKSLVEDCLASVPKQLTLFGRGAREPLVAGKGAGYVASGHNAIFVFDEKTGERRKATKKDVADFARLSDALDNIDFVGIEVMPQDVPAHASLVHAVEAALSSTTKHIYFSPESRQVTEAILGLAKAVVGDGSLSERPIVTCQLSSTSPLFWETGAVEALILTASEGVPCSLLPQPFSGVTAPITLAGLLTMHNAEVLSGIVISQLVRRGSPIIYGSAWSTFDMSEANVLIGTPEATACRIAGAQLARFYGIPSHTIGPDTDSPCHDEQNGWEKMMTTVASLGAGIDLLVNAGMFDTGLSVSYPQLVLDDEIVGWARRYLRGIDVTEETVARDVIDRVGPRGNFLTDEHTFKYLRSPEHWKSRISTHTGYEKWRDRGARSIVEKAAEIADNTIRSHEVEPLSSSILGKMHGIVEKFDRKAVA